MQNNKNYFDSQNSIINDFRIDNTPDISNKLDKLSERLTNIENHLKNNREIYIQLLENINLVSNENKKILTENRQMYTTALKKIEETEIQNMNEIRPIINNISKNNNILENNLVSPLNPSRIHNRFWRQQALPKHNIQNSLNSNISGVLGIPSFNKEPQENSNDNDNELSYNKTKTKIETDIYSNNVEIDDNDNKLYYNKTEIKTDISLNNTEMDDNELINESIKLEENIKNNYIN